MQQLTAARPVTASLRFVDCLGQEEPSPYPADRWLAAAQQQILSLESSVGGEMLGVLEIVSQAIVRLRPGQPGGWDAGSQQQLWDLFRIQPPRSSPSQALEVASSNLAPEEALLFNTVLQEVRALELRFLAFTRLQTKVADIVRDTVQGLTMFMGPEGRVPAGFEEALLLVVQGWSNRLWMSEEEGRHALCVLWATHMAGCFQASQQEWRYCLACLEQTLYRHLGSGLGRLLQSYWNGLPAATALFEICAVVCKQLPVLATKWKGQSFAADELILSALGELLLEVDPVQQHWPMQCALNACAAPLGGVSAADFATFRREVVAAYRPHMERNWLDLLSKPLERIQEQLDVRTWKAQNRTHLQSAYALACTSLREVLQAFSQNARAEQDLRCLLEAAWECTSCARTSLGSQHMFRHWLACLYVPFVATKWQQPKAVLAALKSALQKLPDGAPLAKVSPLLELLPPTHAHVNEGLRLDLSWLPRQELARRAWLGWLSQGGQAASWLGRTSLREWSCTEDATPRPSLQDMRRLCPQSGAQPVLEQMEKKLWRSWLSHQVWREAEAIALHASAWTYKTLGNSAGGLDKCARDNSFTLRRVALAWELEVEDPVAFLSDWWNGMVNAYLKARPSRLFMTNLQGLLEASRDHLDTQEQAELEAVLRPVYEEAAGQEDEQSGQPFQPLKWSFPLEQKLDNGSTLELGDELVQTSLRLAGPFQKPVGPWRNLLQEGWKRYLWQGCLDTRMCQRWAAYIQDNASQPADLAQFLLGLQLAQDNQSPQAALPRLDYFQAMLDFTRQLQQGPEWARGAAERIQQCSPGADDQTRQLLSEWLEQTAQMMVTVPAPLCYWEADRSLLEQCARREFAATFPWTDFLEALRLSLTCDWNFEYAGAAFADVQKLAAVYAGSQEPLFSPNPEEEGQCRQTLSLLLVACWRGNPREAGLVFWALTGSLKITRDREFSARLLKIEEMLRGACPDVPGSLYAQVFAELRNAAEANQKLLAGQRNWPALRAALNSEWAERPDLDGLLLAETLPLTWSASKWALPRKLRLAWTQDRLPQDSSYFQAFPPPSLWQESLALGQESQVRQRELRWHARELAWCAWLQDQALAPEGWRIGPDQPEELAQLAQHFARQGSESGLRTTYEALAARGHFLRLYIGKSPAKTHPWLHGSALLKAAVEAGSGAPDSEEMVHFGQALASQVEGTVVAGQVSSSLHMTLRALVPDSDRAAYYNRLCDGLLSQLPASGLPVVQQLTLMTGVQCIQSSLRHLQLALKLRHGLQDLDLPPGWKALLEHQVQLWLLTSPELAWLNLVAYLQQHPELLLDPADSEDVLQPVRGQLDTAELRVWSEWCRQLARLNQVVPDSLPLLSAWARPECPRVDTETSLLAHQLVALDVLQQAQLPALPALQRLVSAQSLESMQQLVDCSRARLIDVDLSGLNSQWATLVERAEKKALPTAETVQTLQQHFPDSLGAEATDVVALLQALSGANPDNHGPWVLPRSLVLTPERLLRRVTQLPPAELARLQTALGNSLASLKQDPLEAGRWADWCQRLDTLESAWERGEEVVLGGQPAHPFWRSLVRRVALEGWMEGRPYSGKGVLSWIAFNLAAADELEGSRKPFLKACREVLQWARDKGNYSDGMRRVAEETVRALERRLDSPGTGVWECLGAATLDADAARKPFKRTLWGRISSSLEGIVRGR